MLIVGSGLNPCSDWHFCHSEGWGWGGCTQRGLFLALHLHPLPVGGCVNNMATGKINCGQAAGLRGSLCEQREHWVGKACDLWGWEEISQGRLELPFNSKPKEMKALCKEDIEISRQKIVDILERPILLIFIVLTQKGENCERRNIFWIFTVVKCIFLDYKRTFFDHDMWLLSHYQLKMWKLGSVPV